MSKAAAAAAAGTEDAPRTMREIVQRKFFDEVIGSASNWKVLVMDDVATRVISSALTMFDIMERRVTLVENLAKSRQPFPEMEVVYFVTPSTESTNAIINDFATPGKPRYGAVHIVFTDSIPSDVMGLIQRAPALVSRIKTFKEIHMDFLVSEGSVCHFDMPDVLSRLYRPIPDPQCPGQIGQRLANLCITLNEHPSIRYQGSSLHAKAIATVVHRALTDYKKANSSAFWCYGDGSDGHAARDRGQLLLLDRSFDPLSPLMHEYSYQAMVNDLLPVNDGVISYKTTTNKGTVEKQALLSENDDLWQELRYSHIAKVIETIKDRMNDIIQNNSGAALAAKKGADMSITSMAAAVKQLPEYQQTMNKLGQHVAIAQQCMDAFTKQGLLDLSQVEQTASTGYDEDGKEVKPARVLQIVVESLTALASANASPEQRLRLLAILLVARARNGTSLTADERRQLVQAARLDGTDQQVLLNFEQLAQAAWSAAPSAPGTAGAPGDKKSGVFSSLFSSAAGKAGAQQKTASADDYADTRHVPAIRGLLELLMAGELPVDRFPAVGPAASGGASKDSAAKSAAKSVRKFGANARWGASNKGDMQFEGGRYLVFVAGGVCFSETKACHELMIHQKKEVVVSATSQLSPEQFLGNVRNISSK